MAQEGAEQLEVGASSAGVEAQVCGKSCSRIGGSPSAADNTWKRRVTALGLRMRPSSRVNTPGSPTHSGPAASRSVTCCRRQAFNAATTTASNTMTLCPLSVLGAPRVATPPTVVICWTTRLWVRSRAHAVQVDVDPPQTGGLTPAQTCPQQQHPKRCQLVPGRGLDERLNLLHRPPLPNGGDLLGQPGEPSDIARCASTRVVKVLPYWRRVSAPWPAALTRASNLVTPRAVARKEMDTEAFARREANSLSLLMTGSSPDGCRRCAALTQDNAGETV